MAFGVLFDLDETLLDRHGTLLTYASRLFGDFARDANISEADFVALVDKLDERGRAPREEFFSAVASAAFDSITGTQLQEHFYANAWLEPKPFDGVVDSLRELRRRGFPIGVVTNGSKSSQEAKLVNSGLRSFVDAVVISGDFGVRKPDEKIFLHICRQLDIDTNHTWYFGDDPVADILGASRVGMQTVWLERYLPWPDDLERCYRAKVDQVQEAIDLLLPRGA